MRATELLEGYISWDYRLVDFPGYCSKHCLTVTLWFSVLPCSGRPLRHFMLSYCYISVSLSLSMRRFIVSLVGAFLLGKFHRNFRRVGIT